MSAAIPARWTSERSSDAGGVRAPSRPPFLSIVPRDEFGSEADLAHCPLDLPEEDPPADVIQRRTAEPTTLLLICVMVSLVTSGVFAEVWFPRQPIGRAPQAVRLPLENLRMRSSPQLLRLVASQADAAWQPALLELGRRGALTELAMLREHESAAVRALVPIAFLEMGARAHDQIPWLAEGLASPDQSVRQSTMTALRTLARRHGAFCMPAGSERYRDLAHAAP